jgi:hypothetical protein
VHAGHGTGCSDDAAEYAGGADIRADDCTTFTGDSRHDGARHVESSSDSEPVTEPVVSTNIVSNWVRRLWPAERSVVEPVDKDEKSELPHEEVPVTSHLRDRPHESATFRWPCWPRGSRSRRRSH